MKNKYTIITVTLCVLVLLLTSCSGSTATAASWGGAMIADSTVYYADGTQVYALKAENGNTVWSYPEKAVATRIFLAAPVVVGEQVLVGDYGKLLTSLDIRDGKENWQFKEATGNYIDSPLVIGETIIAPNADNSLYALDLDGNKLWEFSGEHSFWAQPASDGTTVFASNMDHNLYAVALGSGTQKWKRDLSASLVARPLLVDGVIYIGNLEGDFFAVNSANGNILWQVKVAGGVWSAPVFAENKLFFGDQKGNINILNAEDGKAIVPAIPTGAPTLGSGVLLTDGILFGNGKISDKSTDQSQLIMIGFDGSTTWSRPVTNGSIYSSLSTDGSTVLVIANKGEYPLLAFDNEGRQIWYFTTKK